MRLMSAEIDDIKRVLAICFRTGSQQTADDLERVLSFDMGWMDTDTAHDSIKALIFSGWIIDEGGILSANCDIRGVKAPLGWQPRPSRLTDPIVNDSKINNTNNVDKPTQKVVSKPKNKENESANPRARMERRLVKYIAKNSGIESEEIMRRAERKVKALRYCTIWLALCLISREQNLEMNAIIDSFSSR